jgi:hypothetical protein
VRKIASGHGSVLCEKRGVRLGPLLPCVFSRVYRKVAASQVQTQKQILFADDNKKGKCRSWFS